MKQFFFATCLVLVALGVFAGQAVTAAPSNTVLTATPLATPTLTFYNPWRYSFTPSPTPTFVPLKQTLNDLEIISPENINRLEIVERWGQGNFLKAILSPNHEKIAVATTAGVYLYRARDLEQIGFLDKKLGGSRYWFQLAFSPDGMLLAVAGSDVTFWDATTLTKLGELPIISEDFHPWHIEFTPDSKHIFVENTQSACGVGGVGGINVALYAITGYKVFDFDACVMGEGDIGAKWRVINNRWVLFSVGREIILPQAAFADETHIIDLSNSQVVHTIRSTSERRLYDLSPDGKLVAYAIDKERTEIVNLQTGQIKATVQGQITFVIDSSGKVSWKETKAQKALSPTPQPSKICGHDTLFDIPGLMDKLSLENPLQVIDSSTCKVKAQMLFHDLDMFDFSRFTHFSPSGEQLVLDGFSMGYLVDIGSGKISYFHNKPRVDGEMYYIRENMSLNLDSSKIILSQQKIARGDFYLDDSDYSGYGLDIVDRFDETKTLTLPVSGRRVDKILPGFGPSTIFVADDQGIHVWNILTGQKVRTIPDAHAMSKTPDGKTLLFDVRGIIHMMDIATWRDIFTFENRNMPYVWEIGVPSQKDRIAIRYSLKDNPYAKAFVTVFDIRTGKQVFDVADAGDEKSENSIEFLFPQPYFVHNRSDGYIELWSPDQDTPLDTLLGKPQLQSDTRLGYERNFNVTLLSPDARIFVTANNGLQFWDVKTGRLLAQMPEQNDGGFSSPLFSLDGRYLVTLGSDGTFWVWGVRKK